MATSPFGHVLCAHRLLSGGSGSTPWARNFTSWHTSTCPNTSTLPFPHCHQVSSPLPCSGTHTLVHTGASSADSVLRQADEGKTEDFGWGRQVRAEEKPPPRRMRGRGRAVLLHVKIEVYWGGGSRKCRPFVHGTIFLECPVVAPTHSMLGRMFTIQKAAQRHHEMFRGKGGRIRVILLRMCWGGHCTL